LGRLGVDRLAALPSLDAALAELVRTPYGRDVRPGMDLRAAQRGVFATLLWHLRILAGWSRPSGAERIRPLAAGFEIANLLGRFAQFGGAPPEPEFTLGALNVGWARFVAAPTIAELRAQLAESDWGDPGSDEIGAIRLALEAVWMERIADRVPEARAWAVAYATILLARIVASGAAAGAVANARRRLRGVLGARTDAASVWADLPACLPRASAWVLDGIAGPDELWRAEARVWARIEREAVRLNATVRPGPEMIVGLVALLAADARRTRAALELAARGGGVIAPWFDAVA
jgi:hypothetical protein